MKAEAEKFAEADKQKKELIDAKNQAEQLTYATEKAIKDAGDKVPADMKKGIEDKIAALKAVKDGSDLAAIKQATEALSAEAQKIGQQAYQQQSQAQAK